MLPLALFFATCAVAQLARPCSKTNVQCVGEKEPCVTTCLTDRQSVCNLCSGTNLICRQGQCHKALLGEGEPCNPSQLLFCRDPLSCDSISKTCKAPDFYEPSKELGETCDPDADDPECQGDLICDDFTKTCVSLSGQDSEGRKLCDFSSGSNKDLVCDFGDFCSVGDVCVNAHKKRGFLCEDDSQCGHTMRCVSPIPNASSVFDLQLCRGFFTVPEGGLCTDSEDCATGQCVDDQCQSPDLSSAGAGCRDTNNDCTRSMTCACSADIEKGGRQRCTPDFTQQYYQSLRSAYSVEKAYLSCLESKGCQSAATGEGTCGATKCGSQLRAIANRGFAVYVNYPDYLQPASVRANQCSGSKAVLESGYGGYEKIIEASAATSKPITALVVGALVAAAAWF